MKAFIEQGESAKFADRTQLIELIDFCRENKGTVQALLVWKVDRFARNVADHFSVKATLAKYGVRIMSVTEPIDANPEGKLMETILAGFAQFDNDIRAARTVQGMRRKLQEGIFPWGPPLGYKSSVTKKEKKLFPDLPDQPTFGLLQRAWRDFATGAYTQAEIGRLMVSRGLTSPHGNGAFSPQFLSLLFTNKYYVGILVDPWSGEEYEGKQAPMVTRDEFLRVQRVIARRNHSVAHQKVNSLFPLRGLIRCDSCSHYMTGGSSRGRSRLYPYYVCRFKACTKYGKSVPIDRPYADFMAFLDQVAPTQEALQKLRDAVLAEAHDRETDGRASLRRSRERARNLDREVDELISMRSKGLITDEEYVRQKRTILERQEVIEGKKCRVINAEHTRKHLTEISAPLGKLRATWESLKPSFRQRFNRLLLPAGFLNGNIRTAQMGRLFNTISTSEGTNSSVVSPRGIEPRSTR